MFGRAQQRNSKASLPLEVYQENFESTEGFFVPTAILIWDFLLSLQAKSYIKGDFLEIGVYMGKSALLGATHLQAGETCILVDLSSIDQAIQKMKTIGITPVSVVGMRSDDPKVRHRLREYNGTVRWFHIDGDHSGYATYGDLQLATSFLGDRGIICVDDFGNLRYPQLQAAVFQFLADNRSLYSMLLCGFNKCYIVRKADYRFYEQAIRKDLMPFLKTKTPDVLLSKSSSIDDGGCFSIMTRFMDVDYLGRDEDAADLPY